jgi:starch synthase
MSEKVLRVLYIASEAGPFVKIGGLGDVAGTLPPMLSRLQPADTGGWKIDIRLVIPYHPAIAQKFDFGKPILTLNLHRKSGDLAMDVYQTDVDGMPVYFIDGDLITRAENIYNFQPELDMPKFAAFSFAALELAKQLDFQPHILNANDWHTALAVYALKKKRRWDPFFRGTRSVFTVHNLPYMGSECKPILQDYGCFVWPHLQLPKWGRSFAMPLGLLSADHINAVSPTYAQEIQTPAFGCSLEHFLARRSNRISGIINGLDYQDWNPAIDPQLPQNFDVDHLDQRAANKLALQAEFGLAQDANVPLIILISRMDHQKGMDIAFSALRLAVDEPWQAVILGTGAEVIEEQARQLEADFPERVKAAIRFDGKLARRMYAAGDVILLPSHYEPCGLTQLIGMRYGCIPIAHAVGGFADTIQDDRDPADWTGFLFRENTPDMLAEMLHVAFSIYTQQPETWQAIQRNGMRQDWSWKRSALKYLQLYLDVGKAGVP